MRRSTPLALAGLAMVGLLAGCSGAGDESLAPTDPSPSTATPSATPTTPAPSSTASPSSSTPAGETSARAVYYVMDTGRTGPRLYREFAARPDTGDILGDAVETMLTRPAQDPDYTSLWPTDTEVLAARVEGSTAFVDLSEQATQGGAGSAFEAASLQQLVHTVTAAEPSAERVQLLVDGEPVETLWGAVDTSEPVRRGPAAEVLGAVWLLTPTEGGTLAQGAEFGGQATVFEATVNWEWVQGDTVVADGFSTASEGAPGRGDWAGTVDVPPGDYVLRAFESSAEDSQPTFVDSKRVTVTG